MPVRNELLRRKSGGADPVPIALALALSMFLIVMLTARLAEHPNDAWFCPNWRECWAPI
jgi:hypothetical protein